MRELDKFRDLAARIRKYGISEDLPALIGGFGLSVGQYPTIAQGEKYTLTIKNGLPVINKTEVDPNRERISKQLFEARKRRGLTTRELGEMVGVNHSTIVRIEAGTWSYGIDQLNRVCSALGCSVEIIDPLHDGTKNTPM